MTDDAHRGIMDRLAVAQSEIVTVIAGSGMVPDAGDVSAMRCAVVRPRHDDCGCTAGTVCRQNGNCPRRVVHKRPT